MYFLRPASAAGLTSSPPSPPGRLTPGQWFDFLSTVQWRILGESDHDESQRRGSWRPIFLIVSIAAARAEDASTARVKELHDSGRTHYNLGEYREAIEDFKEAYRLRHDPVFLFNIGQSYRQLGDRTNTVQAYRSYLRELPQAPNRELVERFIQEAEAAPSSAPPVAPTPSSPPPPTASGAKQRPVLQPAPSPPAPSQVESVVGQRPPEPHKVKEKTSRKVLWGSVGGGVAVGVGLGLGLGLGLPPATDFGSATVSFP